MRTLALCLLLSVSVTGQSISSNDPSEEAHRKERPGSLSGSVIDAATASPIAEAAVWLLSQEQGNGLPRNATQADGRFRFANVTPGRYYLQATHYEYPGPLGGPQFGIEIEVEPGKETTGVQITLAPPAVASGHVLNDDGEPVSGCNVQLMPAKARETNSRIPLGSVSNDKGALRIIGVPPDRYHAFVHCNDVLPTEHLLDVVPRTGWEIRSIWLPAFYPTSPTRAGALEFPVAPGLDPNLEFHLQATPVSTLTGPLSAGPGVAWHNPPVVQLRDLNDEREDPFTVFLGGMIGAPNTFVIPAVPPGTYQLVATTQDYGSTTSGSAVFPLAVGNTAPTAFPIVLQAGVPVTGVVEDAPGFHSMDRRYTTITEQTPTGPVTRTEKQPAGKVALEPVNSSRYLSLQAADVDSENGRFTFPAVPSGRWRIRYQSYGNAAQVESLQLNDTVVDGNEIVIAPGPSPTLRIRLGPRPRLQFEIANPPDGGEVKWMVLALPEQETLTGSDTFVAIGKSASLVTIFPPAPGRYRFVAMELGFASGRESDRDRIVRLLAQQVDAVEIAPTANPPIPVRCFSIAEVKKAISKYLYGDDPPPAAP